MEVTEQIENFQKFIEMHYLAELLECIRKGQTHFVVDFGELIKFSPELADMLLEQPEEVIKACELSISNFDLPAEVKNFRIRFCNLPDKHKIFIRNIRSKHINKLLLIEGTVRQKSDVRPQVTAARFECPSCGNVMSILQLDTKFKEPSRCGCGRKGKFRLLSKELVDVQGIVLEEATKDLEGGAQPKRINVLLKNDLVSPMSDKKTNPGTSIQAVGILKEVPIILRSGGQSTKYDLIIDVNNVIPLEEDYTNIMLNEKDRKDIEELAKDPKIIEKIATSLAPGIYGHDRIKEALALQFVGGVKKLRDDGVMSRGDIHMLLIGDPGAGKSQMLKRAAVVAPKARFVSGKGVSGAGLTAAVVRDEFLSGWSLEAGAMVLSNKGILMIDEMDKMTDEDRSAMHEGMEQQTISISKANIQATLRCETTILAAANPKFGRFDPYETISKQINLPPALINRFDLIFTIKDIPDREKDEALAEFILRLHKDHGTQAVPIDTDMLRKYFIYARQLVIPKLTEEALNELKEYYIKMRSSGGGDEKEIQAIPISARQLEALVRLSEATAKLTLSNKIEKKHARAAINIFHYCLEQVGMDPETGRIDIDRISTGITTSERAKLVGVRDIITELEKALNNKVIPIEEIIKSAKEKGLNEDKVLESIQKLKRSGDLFEPRKGHISRI
ncbi:AAA family ATPase [Candidatus Woesearchaeota archaeon CG10_big_fil_rev_8_21_14_0_10_34_8]|nr:MAG: AAA family ATPase [Candidatus Woesearchaeota archaeon CG10_big_fil_rev_8_21_14_0_10_34_8]